MRPVTFTSWTSILDYDIDNTDNHLPLAAVDFGVAFQLALSDAKLDRTPAADDIKLRCRDYVLQLLSQMRTRLPLNVERLQSLSELSPSVVLGRYKPGLSQVSFLPLYSGDIAQLEMQWNRVSLLPWPNTNDTDIEQFWIDTVHHKNAAEQNDFTELGSFALSLLALPFSNAAVERTFSQMNLIKNKLRNRMKQGCLEALLNVRAYFARTGTCCNAFEPSAAMLSRFTSDIYKSSAEADDEDDVIPDDFVSQYSQTL